MYETPGIFHDTPLRDDDKAFFYFDEFAITLSRLIAEKNTRTPLTLCVSGPWGTGKTTLLRRVKKMLDATKKIKGTKPANLDFANPHENLEETFRTCKTVWFNAWKYSKEEHVLAALLRQIQVEMSKDGFLNQIKKALSAPKEEEFRWLGLLISGLVQFSSAGTYDLDLSKYVLDTPFKNASSFYDYFENSINRLLAAWVSGKLWDKMRIDEKQYALVVFIDDLDRCLPEKTVQVLESVKLFMDSPGCVFVIGADTSIIQQAVFKHYKEAEVTPESAGDYAKDYLEKLIQIRFELPPIVTGTMKAYLADELNADEVIQRNWHIVVAGAEINPRKVKTFVNDLNLQWTVLKNTGQAQDVDRDDFTSWQVLMRAAPENFIRRIQELDDVQLRFKFVTEALLWVAGEKDLETVFQDYSKSLRLRRVLRAIKTFSPKFTPEVLDAFVHLTAPPKLEPIPRSVEGVASKIREEAGMRTGREGIEIGGIRFVQIPKGKFIMGSRDDNSLASDDEKPQHAVEITYDYWMAKFPVTKQEFFQYVKAVKAVNEKWESADVNMDHPMVNVSWDDAMNYCRWKAKDVATELPQGYTLTLPSEAEWEKAARGEYGNEWPWGNDFDATRCNTSEGGKKGTTPAGAYSPAGDSPYGCVDMAGNVWEWCRDWYDENEYQRRVESGSPVTNPQGPAEGTARVVRGGSWNYLRDLARCAYRYGDGPDYFDYDLGFRVVLSPF